MPENFKKRFCRKLYKTNLAFPVKNSQIIFDKIEIKIKITKFDTQNCIFFCWRNFGLHNLFCAFDL